jgi:hypothetical protein
LNGVLDGKFAFALCVVNKNKNRVKSQSHHTTHTQCPPYIPGHTDKTHATDPVHDGTFMRRHYKQNKTNTSIGVDIYVSFIHPPPPPPPPSPASVNSYRAISMNFWFCETAHSLAGDPKTKMPPPPFFSTEKKNIPPEKKKTDSKEKIKLQEWG